MAICGAKKKDGTPCQMSAMPNGRCRLHGGKAGRPVTHGRYSKSVPKDLSERYEYFKTDPEWLSLKPDLALTRTMMERFMATFVEGQYISAEVGGELRQWFDLISRVAERANKILNGDRYTINVPGLQAVIAQIGDIVNNALSELDESTANRIRDKIVGQLASIHGTGAVYEDTAESED